MFRGTTSLSFYGEGRDSRQVGEQVAAALEQLLLDLVFHRARRKRAIGLLLDLLPSQAMARQK
ncbi:hypothetical protein [Mesorhizobium sp.]|uniref:hypothetical protein n=1 Tax=Mesorhizobium sp. TaxID=1871066 RepID=UPI00257D29C3|nr:hypothetical protein [Mesorhizobium sp.]